MYKESLPRSELLRLADDVVNEIRMDRRGQYQITELLMCTAVDRHIVRLLKLPGYRAWCNGRRQQAAALEPLATIPLPALRIATEHPEGFPAACVG